MLILLFNVTNIYVMQHIFLSLFVQMKAIGYWQMEDPNATVFYTCLALGYLKLH